MNRLEMIRERVKAKVDRRFLWQLCDWSIKVFLFLFSGLFFLNSVLERWSFYRPDGVESTAINTVLLILQVILSAWIFIASFLLYFIVRYIVVFYLEHVRKPANTGREKTPSRSGYRP